MKIPQQTEQTAFSSAPPIAVVGAGIAGLGACLALQAHDVQIFESSSEFSDVGAGIQLGPNAVNALQKLGAWDAVRHITSEPPEIHVRDGITGALLKRVKLGQDFLTRYGSPYRVARRADLHKGLLDVVKTQCHVQFNMAVSCSAAMTWPDGVSLHCNDQVVHAPAVVVADGVHSTVRQSLFAHSGPIDSGDRYYRAMIDPPAGVEDCVVLWLLPHAHVVQYLVGADQKLNVVAVAPAGVETNVVFGRACSELSTVLAECLHQSSVWPGLYVNPLSNWVKGSTLLLGDAAHGTLPYLAQGAAMALEDAACLAAVVKTTSSLQHAFAETAQRRLARTLRLHQQSLSAGKTYHHHGVMRQLRNFALRLAPDMIFRLQTDWIYKNG
jgi:2-polyprenyl-6-methoxyphenol hydroxylase-like FAD-dependent oxidoreductase